jgi:hypothetical protein
MAMNVGESSAVNRLVSWIVGELGVDGKPIDEEMAMEAAALLAESAYKKLWAGYHGEQVRDLWRKRRL